MNDISGQQVPKVEFKNRANNDWNTLSYDDVFAGKKVVIFSLPGAFTPTCSSSHLPRYEELYSTLKANGVDEVYCISVNDGFVMEAWGQDQEIQNVKLLADGNGDFTEGMGMLVDKSDIGFGKRSWRYSMVVTDGVVEKMFIEPDKPGDPFEVSDADTMREYIAPNAELPADVTLFAKPNCPFCIKAKALLKEKGYSYEEIVVGPNDTNLRALRSVTGRSTVPQVYINSEHIGGSEELEAYFAK